MNIPEEYRERYDSLAKSHPWMREMRDETNGIPSETNGIACDSPLVELPEGDAVSILREAASNISDYASVGEALRRLTDTTNIYYAVEAIAAMVERDYVRRDDFDFMSDALKFTKAERDEWKAKAEQALHENPFVGLVRGKEWERTESSDYYCGRCGWKVTDHDSYCPECGGALHGGSSKVRAGSSKRAAAVERLRNCYYTTDSDLMRAMLNWGHEPHDGDDSRFALIDLLTDNESGRSNDGVERSNTTIRLSSQSVAPESVEIAARDTTKCEIHDFDDTREKEVAAVSEPKTEIATLEESIISYECSFTMEHKEWLNGSGREARIKFEGYADNDLLLGCARALKELSE